MDRHLDERLALYAPQLYRWIAKLMLALPPGSPVRRRAVKRMVARAWAALSRGDDAVVLFIFHPDLEFNVIGGETQVLDLGEHHHGHEGWLEFIRRWRGEWVGSQITHTPEAVIDLGDRLVMRVTLTARGATSGTDVALTMGIVSWLADGAVVRQDNYYRWADCVEALGLGDAAAAVST